MADFIEGYISMKQHVLVRFGKWREIIAQELPADRDVYCSTTAMMLYAKGLAHSVLGEIAEAEAARAAFPAAKARVPESRLVHNNTVVGLLDIAERDADAASSNTAAATWAWPSPICAARSSSRTRCPTTSRGAGCSRRGMRWARSCWSRASSPRPRRSIAPISASTGRPSRSCWHPDNVWSLHGLHQCLIRRGETVEAPLIKARLDLAARAPVRRPTPVRAVRCLPGGTAKCASYADGGVMGRIERPTRPLWRRRANLVGMQARGVLVSAVKASGAAHGHCFGGTAPHNDQKSVSVSRVRKRSYREDDPCRR